MKLRLVVKNDGPVRTVEVHGELVKEALPELERVCHPRAGLVIDLSNLRHVDSQATTRLRELSASGVKLVGASHFINMLIQVDRD